MKIGLIADTHMPGTLADLWPQASRAFEGVDAILHAGDLHTLEIVEHLSDIAPTYVSRGNGDLDIVDQLFQTGLIATPTQNGMIAVGRKKFTNVATNTGPRDQNMLLCAQFMSPPSSHRLGKIDRAARH